MLIWYYSLTDIRVAEKAEYSFWVPPTSNTTILPLRVNPFPSVSRAGPMGPNLLLEGDSLRQDFACFFGEHQAAKATVACSQLIIAQPPRVKSGSSSSLDEDGTEDDKVVPILLVRRKDGIVFRTGFYYRL